MPASLKGNELMPGTRTAPEYDGTPTSVLYTIHLIDAGGDTFTDALRFLTPPTTAELEAHVVAYQAATNASVYGISRTDEYFGEADPDNAVFAARSGVQNGVNCLFRNATTLQSTTPRVVAPIAEIMQGNQDIPLVTATAFTALLTSYLTVLGADWSLDSVQYTSRRERTNNPRIKT